jgi:hypothetical protein
MGASDARLVVVGYRGNDDRQGTLKYTDKSSRHLQLVNKKSCTKCLGIEPDPPQEEAGNWLSELWHGLFAEYRER